MTTHPEPKTYRHEALLWRGDSAFLDGCVPFIREGLALAEPVMVATTPARTVLLQQALGSLAAQVRFVDMADLGANPARVIPAWTDFVGDAAGRPSRGIGELLWAGRSPVEVSECLLHESLLNLALPVDAPLWLRCPYDVDAFPRAVIEEVERIHPVVADGGLPAAPSRAYAGPDRAHAVFAATLPEAPGTAAVDEFGVGDLRRIRREVAAAAESWGVGRDRSADLALAVHELAANSVLHGGGRGVLRIWREPGALVCEVTDEGQVRDVLAGRVGVATLDGSGRGLWMVNQLCDLVQLRSSRTGTIVRVHTWL